MNRGESGMLRHPKLSQMKVKESAHMCKNIMLEKGEHRDG